MLESLYNLARSKVLTGDEAGAIQNLKTVILQDHVYCLKTAADSDFNNTFKEKLFSQIKSELLPKVKSDYNGIKNLQNVFKGPYSKDLVNLIYKNLPESFAEDTPPFDILEASICFPKILSLLESERDAYEHDAYIKKCKEQEVRVENERRQKEEAEQERENKLRRIEREKEEAKEKSRKRRYIIWNVIPVLLQVLVVVSIILNEILDPSPSSSVFNTILGCLFFIIPFLIIFFAEGRIKKIISLIVIVLFNIFIFRYFILPGSPGYILPGSPDMFFVLGLVICSLTSCVTALIIRWQ